MTSLVRREWVVPLGAAILAVFIPFHLLSAPELPVPVPPDHQITPFTLVPPVALNHAFLSPAFSPTRLPAGTADPAQLATNANKVHDSAQALPPALPELPKLVGLALSKRGRGVALVKQADGKTVALSRGESADGWVLTALSRDNALFKQGGERRSAQLAFPQNAGSQGRGPIPAPPPGTGAIVSLAPPSASAPLSSGPDQ
jgi:hypothetical protein